MPFRITHLMLISMLPLLLHAQKGQSTMADIEAIEHNALYANSWNLIELNGTSTLQPGLKQAYITFKPSDYNYNRLSGFTGCNYMSGRIDLSGKEDIAFHLDIITYNNCAGSSVESPLIETLLHTDAWAEKNGQLLLYKKGKVVAKWASATYSNKNLNGIWQLSYLRDHTVPFNELFPITHCPSMIFADGKSVVTGYSGCHEFICPVMINQNSIVFAENAPRDTTGCEVHGENVFLFNLNNVNAYAFKDDKTLVLIADDKPVMAFTRR